MAKSQATATAPAPPPDIDAKLLAKVEQAIENGVGRKQSSKSVATDVLLAARSALLAESPASSAFVDRVFFGKR